MAAISTLNPNQSSRSSHRAYIVVIVFLIWLTYRGISYYWSRTRLKAPLLFSELDSKSRAQKWYSECHIVMQSGYRLFRNQHVPMFRATMEDGSETVIINDRYLKELKSLPDNVLSIEEGVNTDLLSKYSHIKVLNPIGQHAIRSDLTPGLPRLMPSIASEAVFALKTHFPQDADDWVQVTAFKVVLDSVAQVSARLFVGAELCRNPRWLQCSQAAAINAFSTISAMKVYPAWMRPFVQRFIPEKQALERARAEAIAILTEDAAAKERKGNRDKEEDYLLNWVAKKNPEWARDFAAQADLQLELSVAAIHTTTMTLTQILYDLAAHPEYIQILRDEVRAALSQTSGTYNRDCIAKMVKTDSFMKESQRLHPGAFTSFKRRVLKEFTLSDGTVVPKGIGIEVDASARYHDPNFWENPEQFDGLRFLRLTEESQQKGSHQFVASNQDYVFWGQGKHACPGRFFAANEIKTLLAMFLLNYDVALPQGTQRPPDLCVGTFINPNPTAQILVRRTQS